MINLLNTRRPVNTVMLLPFSIIYTGNCQNTYDSKIRNIAGGVEAAVRTRCVLWCKLQAEKICRSYDLCGGGRAEVEIGRRDRRQRHTMEVGKRRGGGGRPRRHAV